MIATGHHDVPRFPKIPGKFTGEIMHSRDYRSVKQLIDKVVVVVGAGNSACDIVVDATSVARAVYQSMRRGTYFVPKFMLGRPTDGIVNFCEKMPMPRACGMSSTPSGTSSWSARMRATGCPSQSTASWIPIRP